MSLPSPYVRLVTSTEALPAPEKEYIRVFIVNSSDENPSTNVVASFAVHKRIARHCKLLESMLDELDLAQETGDEQHCGVEGAATIPDVDPFACATVFDFLELTVTRVPSMIARPLRAPIQEVVQPWESAFLLEKCLENRDPQKHQPLLDVMKVSDFLIVDSLRDLTCAFLASLVLQCSTEAEMLKLLGIARPLTSEDLEPLYDQFPFLK